MRDLRAQRELRGLGLREVAEATGVPTDILASFEAEPDAQLAPGSTIARWRERYVAYLQQRPVPLEPESVHAASEPGATEHTETTSVTGALLRSPVGLARALGLGIALAAVVLLGLRVAAELWDAGTGEGRQGAVTAVDQQVLEPAVHALSVRAIEPSKLRAVADGEVIHDGVLLAGRSLQLEAHRELSLDVPDLTRVRIRYNGQALRPLGNLSAGRRLVFIDDEGP